MMFRLAQAVVLSSGWRRRLIAFVAGACGALAMAPVDAFPALIVPMTVAVWLIDGCAYAEPGGRVSGRTLWASLRSAADAGWWWGFGYFVAGLWWLGSAFLVEPDKFAWLLPFGVLGLPAYLALYAALGFALARLLWSAGPGRVLAFAVSMMIAEWLRGTLLTGFPWNEFGMALGDSLVLGQLASLIGLHGLTFLACLLAAAPATLADHWRPGPGLDKTRLVPSLGALLVLAGIAGFGALRLATPAPTPVAGVHLRVVQPNATIDADFSYEHKDAILRHYLTLSDRATSPTATGLADVTHVVWPESPFPFILSRDAGALAAIGNALGAKATLITGAARLEAGPVDQNGRPTPRYYNAIQVVTRDGTIIDSYDKVHLVPFGEYLPLKPLLNRLGIQNFVHVPGGFEAGTTRHLLNVPGLPPVAAIICYEAIFSGEVVPPGGTRPGLLLNVTDDAWFGRTAGPYQHFAQARLRSIEEGIPLVRSASTGISAIVDAYGRVTSSLPIGAENVIDGPLPGAIEPPPFARYGNAIPFGLLLAALLAAIGFRLLS
jgi:apolipoprotein N-acyltransferase